MASYTNSLVTETELGTPRPYSSSQVINLKKESYIIFVDMRHWSTGCEEESGSRESKIHIIHDVISQGNCSLKAVCFPNAESLLQGTGTKL